MKLGRGETQILSCKRKSGSSPGGAWVSVTAEGMRRVGRETAKSSGTDNVATAGIATETRAWVSKSWVEPAGAAWQQESTRLADEHFSSAQQSRAWALVIQAPLQPKAFIVTASVAIATRIVRQIIYL